MTTADLPSVYTKWWESVSTDQDRDLMGTLTDAEQEHLMAQKLATAAINKRNEWKWRIEELQKRIHRRIGAKP